MENVQFQVVRVVPGLGSMKDFVCATLYPIGVENDFLYAIKISSGKDHIAVGDHFTISMKRTNRTTMNSNPRFDVKPIPTEKPKTPKTRFTNKDKVIQYLRQYEPAGIADISQAIGLETYQVENVVRNHRTQFQSVDGKWVINGHNVEAIV